MQRSAVDLRTGYRNEGIPKRVSPPQSPSPHPEIRAFVQLAKVCPNKVPRSLAHADNPPSPESCFDTGGYGAPSTVLLLSSESLRILADCGCGAEWRRKGAEEL
jgi:hypothetical protein